MKLTPLIYEADKTAIDGYALGGLPDALSCKVTEERNGEYFCEMTYPAQGRNAALIRVGRILYVSVSTKHLLDIFRISTITKHLDGTMDITAYHISYDLNNVIVLPFSLTTTAGQVMTNLLAYGAPANNFALAAYGMNTPKTFTVSQPTPLRSLLVGTEGSVVDVYGGDLQFNGWNVKLIPRRGQDKNIQIAYAKNLNEFTETDELGAYDSVVPFAVFNETVYYLTDTTVCATAPIVYSSANYDYPRTIALDVSENFQDAAPTQAELLAAAESYISGHSTASTASYKTGFVDLRKLLGAAEEINIGDVIFLTVPQYSVQNIQLKVIRTIYDALLDEYESVEVGDKKVTLADTLAELMGAQK